MNCMWIDFSYEGGLFPNGIISWSGLAWIGFIAWIQRFEKCRKKSPLLLFRNEWENGTGVLWRMMETNSLIGPVRGIEKVEIG